MTLAESLIHTDRSPEFYQYYPRLFAAYFPEVNHLQIEQLSEAGYLYYHSILLIDSVIDDGDISNLPLITELQEEAVKILVSIYGSQSAFWNLWNKRRKEYFEAAEIEQQLKLVETCNFETFANLAVKKSAFAKAALDALWILSNQNNTSIYQKLLVSHAYFSIGFQLYDDFRDFKEDLEKTQFNWGIYCLKQALNFGKYSYNYQVLNKLFFVKGTGERLLGQSIDQFKEALSITERLKVQSEWQGTITKTLQKVIKDLDTTTHYLKSLKTQVTNESNFQ